MNKLCLVMMVKNEGKIIKRCLDTVKHLVDYIIITDTGSNDNTIDQIKLSLKDIPHEIHYNKWVNFGYNRTKAIQRAKEKAEYSLLLDADEVLIDLNFNKENLTEDAYCLKYAGNVEYAQIRIIKNNLNWKYIGVTHEYIACKEAKNIQIIPTLKFSSFDDGGNRPEKFTRDIDLLTQGLIDEPNNPRYYFYLAQTYNDIGQYQKAIDFYAKRIKFGGWEEEVFYSKLQIAKCFEALKKYKEAKIYYLEAFEYRPTRVEPLYFFIRLCNILKEYNTAYLISQQAIKIKQPNDILFVYKDIYAYLLLLEKSVSAYWIRKYNEAFDDCQKITKIKSLPAHIKVLNLQNIGWITKAKFTENITMNEALHKYGHETLRELHKLFIKNNIPYIIMAGTLLGFYREEKFITSDNDIDLGIIGDKNKDKIVNILTQNGFNLLNIFGKQGQSLEYRFFKKGIQIDIFFFYEENNQYYFALSDNNNNYYKAFVDKFKIVEYSFRNIVLNTPSNIPKYLQEEYGEDWQTPNENFHYLRDRKNIRKMRNSL